MLHRTPAVLILAISLIAGVAPSAGARTGIPYGVGSVCLIHAKLGGQLSAQENVLVGGVTLSPNSDAWEQWEYRGTTGAGSNVGFQSFHGTTLLLEYLVGSPAAGTVTHVPLYAATDMQRGGPTVCALTAAGLCTTETRSGWQPDQEVALIFPDQDKILGRDAAGALTLSPLSTALASSIPDQQRWRIEVLTTPKPMRKPARIAVDGVTSVKAKSFHGTYLMKTSIEDARHGGSATSLYIAPRGGGPARFWWDVTISTTADGSSMLAYSGRRGGSFNLNLAVWGGWSSLGFVLVPCAGGVDGNRVARGDKVCVYQPYFRVYLSAEQGTGIVTWSANSAAWEQWTLE